MMISLFFWTLTFTCTVAVNNYQHEQYEVNYYSNDEDTNQNIFDPNEYYFQRIRAYESQIKDNSDYLDAPKPGGLSSVYADENKKLERVDITAFPQLRSRREAEATPKTANTTENQTETPQVVSNIGKPLEIAILDTENSTMVPINSTPEIIQAPLQLLPESGLSVIINDFIRFKRDLENRTGDNDEARSGRMLLASEDEVFSGNREPRGVTKEQWIKQPYPVQNKAESNYEDVSLSASENVRAPRVHFVTQRRSESAPPAIYRQYDPDGSSRDKDLARDSLRNVPRATDRDFYVRRSRHYDPYLLPPPHYYEQRYDPYYRLDNFRHRRYEQKYEPERDDGYGKNRRIIYYATLPEVVRSPPNADLRDRYSYRDRYDDRYVTSPPLSVTADPYRYRKAYLPNKARYEERERTKVPYPVKVSTDVSVREIKKNPERRIYSEADQRYAYKAPAYHPESTYNRRQ